ncbi:MAG: hypothetical protein JJLCMIEE_02883 [Acidimicrobiales bacterium]|nr:hypothetical protein [Acidimicrobiales bacterium]
MTFERVHTARLPLPFLAAFSAHRGGIAAKKEKAGGEAAISR